MSYDPKPSLPRPIHSPVDHYDVDVSAGTATYHVVQTNGDRIRSMSDEELAEYLSYICYDLWKMLVDDPKNVWLDWLKSPVEVSG